MKDARFLPEEIGPTEDASRLRVRWRDGHVSEFTPWELRVSCPCAGCVDEMTGERTLQPEKVDSGIHPLEIGYIGRYALGFRWSDGHQTGIYPFEYLRRLCRCPECESG